MVSIEGHARLTAAIMAGRSSEMDRVANRVKMSVLRIAAESRLTGAFMDSVSVQKVPGEAGVGVRVRDRIIVTTDPAALSIEYGHHASGRDQPGINLPNAPANGTRVPGKFIFTRAWWEASI